MTEDDPLLQWSDIGLPRGTQIASPGGLSFRRSHVGAVEAYGGREGYLIIYWKGGGSTKVTFYGNVYDDDAPQVYGVKAAIEGRPWP